MGNLSHLHTPFFKDNIFYDSSKESNYGVVPLEINEDNADKILKEAMRDGVEVQARTHGNDSLRTVQCWRINQIDSMTADIIGRQVIDLNSYFNYKLSGIQDIQYLEYHAQERANYDWHIDIGDGVSGMRKISISYVLNDGFEGGDLQFFGDGGNVITVNSTRNKLVGFTSFFHHRVTPVTKGIRKVLVCWVLGEQWR